MQLPRMLLGLVLSPEREPRLSNGSNLNSNQIPFTFKVHLLLLETADVGVSARR